MMFKKFGFGLKMFKKILGFEVMIEVIEVMIEVMMQLIWLGLAAAAAALAALGKSSLGLR